jgi:hypothetical protein
LSLIYTWNVELRNNFKQNGLYYILYKANPLEWINKLFSKPSLPKKLCLYFLIRVKHKIK